MSLGLPPSHISLIDAAFAKLRHFGSALKAVNEENGWFFQIVFELIDSALSNYQHLKTGYNNNDDHLSAWACRNLLELAIFMKYVLASKANARRFAQDRLIDGREIILALKSLELHIDPKSDTTLLDEALATMQAQMAAEGVTEMKHLSTNKLAELIGMKQDYDSMNRVCSKLVHPTAWSIIAVNKGENAFSQARAILLQSGATYGCIIFEAIKEHHTKHGMRPGP